MLCSGEMWTNVYFTQIESQPQTEVKIPLKSNLVNQCVLLGPLIGVEERWHLRRAKMPHDSYSTKAPSLPPASMAESSWKLETWSSRHSLQAARQFRRHLFQADQLLWASSRQCNWAKGVSQQSLLHMLCWRRGCVPINFRDFRVFLSCLLP